MSNRTRYWLNKVKASRAASIWMAGTLMIVGLVIGSVCLAYVIAQGEATNPGENGTDWPTYMHDNARSGLATDTVSLPLMEQWVYTAPAAPKPAWPDPQDAAVGGRFERPRMKFDDAFHVAIVNNAVYFGSSVDNKVYSLEASSGKVRWTFFTEGPVRLAPTVYKGRVYVGSDDGYVYCLNAADGRLIWKFRGAPNDQRVLGSGKMISLWPIRTSVLVDDDIAYFGAGVFPGERVYMYAVRAEDGSLIWKNDTASDQRTAIHRRAGQFDFSPQGYLLASASYLFAPSGRSAPSCFARKDGRFVPMSWEGVVGGGTPFGTYALLTDDLIYAGRQMLVAYSQTSGQMAFFWARCRRLVLTPSVAYLLSGSKTMSPPTPIRLIQAIDWIAYNKKEKKDAATSTYATADELREKYLEACTKWRYERTGLESMIVAGELLFVGGENEVVAIDRTSGKELWTSKVMGTAKGLAVAGGHLFVSTDKGNIHCFGQGTPSQALTAKVVAHPYPQDELTPLYKRAARTIIRETGVNKGYCLVLGCGTGRLAYELAKRTDLMIYGIEPDARKVKQAREALDAAGVYGTRVCVDQGKLDSLPYSDYFANLVVCDEAIASGRLRASAQEAYRVLKPCGGVLYIGQPTGAYPWRRLSEKRLENWLHAADTEESFKVTSNRGTWAKLVRASLPGAGRWTHQYGNPGNTASSDDQVVKAPLGVLWYGEPGANKFPNRHDRNVAPLSINGRVFAQGVNLKEGKDLVMCFDAYNGVMYWEREIPGARRLHMSVECSNMACTEESLFVATGSKCLRLDVATGRTKATYEVPLSADGNKRKWAYVAVADGSLFGSTSPAKAISIEPLTSSRPITPEIIAATTSDSVFALDIETGKQRWIYQGKKIRDNAIAISEGRVFFADDRATSKQRREALEQKIEELKAEKGMDEAAAEKELREADVRVVVALDAATGRKVWEKAVDLTGVATTFVDPNRTYRAALSAICKDGVLLFVGAHKNGHYWPQFFGGEFDSRRIVALSVKDGALLWSKAIAYVTRPLVIGDTIYAEPWAFDLYTGEQKMRSHPWTGKPTPWEFARPGHHCGPISGCPNALFFRSYFTAYYDLVSDEGTSHFVGNRPGCWINIIPANGLVIEPEASSGCTCQFSLQCTVVFEPREPNKCWGIFASRGEKTPINHMAINIGGPGDRRDNHGTLWLGYPRPVGLGAWATDKMRFDVALDITTLPGHSYFNHAAEHCPIADTDTPWLYSSGCAGLTALTIPVIGKEEPGAVYTVRLGFAELENSNNGQRVFDIRLQDRLVEKDFDIIRAAGGPNRAVVREFKGIEIDDDLKIELTPKVKRSSTAQPPILNSIEIVREVTGLTAKPPT